MRRRRLERHLLPERRVLAGPCRRRLGGLTALMVQAMTTPRDAGLHTLPLRRPAATAYGQGHAGPMGGPAREEAGPQRSPALACLEIWSGREESRRGYASERSGCHVSARLGRGDPGEQDPDRHGEPRPLGVPPAEWLDEGIRFTVILRRGVAPSTKRPPQVRSVAYLADRSGGRSTSCARARGAIVGASPA